MKEAGKGMSAVVTKKERGLLVRGYNYEVEKMSLMASLEMLDEHSAEDT